MNLYEEKQLTRKYNDRNPGNEVTLVIDEFEGDYWWEDKSGRRLDILEEHKIIMCN